MTLLATGFAACCTVLALCFSARCLLARGCRCRRGARDAGGGVCAHCGKTQESTNESGEMNRLRRCKCQAVWYCDAECQRRDWPAHRAEHRRLLSDRGAARTAAATAKAHPHPHPTPPNTATGCPTTHPQLPLPAHLWSGLHDLDRMRAKAAAAGEVRGTARHGGSPLSQFLPFACASCYRGTFTGTALFRCPDCRIVRHCRNCLEHGISHDSCSLLQIGARFANDQCPLVTVGNATEKKATADAQRFRRHVAVGSLAIRAASRRGVLKTGDRASIVQVWNRQAHCLQCFARDDLVALCPRCHSVALCRSCAGDGGDWAFGDPRLHSRSACDNWTLTTCVQSTLARGAGWPGVGNSDVEEEEPLPPFHFPTGWESYFHSPRTRPARLRTAADLCIASDALSTPLTILHCLCLAYGHDAVGRMNALTVHFVGAARHESFMIGRYLELSRRMPGLQRLHLVLVGPSMPKRLCNVNVPVRDPRESGASTHRCEATCDFVALPYEEYRHSPAMPPDLVFAQHSGCEDEKHYNGGWRPALERLCRMNVPCAFTGYTLQESVEGARRIGGGGLDASATISAKAQYNPFRGLTPIPDAAHDGFYHINTAFFMFRGAGRGVP